MYRCSICGAASRPREPMIKHVRYKPGTPRQIASETPVCRACARQLEMGLTVAQIMQTLNPAPAPEPVMAVVPLTQRVEI